MRTTARRERRHRLAPALGLVVIVALVAAGCGDDGGSGRAAGSTTTTARPKPAAVATGFEDAGALDGAEVGNATITADAARNGGRGLEVRSQDSDAYVAWAADRFGGERPYWSFRGWVRVVAWTPDQSVDLFTVRNRQVVNNFDLFVGAPWRKLQWDLFRGNSVETPWQAELGQWYLVEARGSFGTSTYTADVRIDGVEQPSIASPDQPPSAVKEFVLGSIGTTKTNRVQFDDVEVRAARTPLPFLGAPLGTPPATATRGTRP